MDLLIIWDNSERNLTDWTFAHKLWSNVIIHQAGVNHGLSFAYNKAIDIAIQNHCTHLMTMDQDSQFENYASFRSQIENCTDDKVGIFVSPINRPLKEVSKEKYLEWCIQSSSTFRIDMLIKIGCFRSDLFIDMVDTEISLKAVEAGYKILQVKDCNLIHQGGSGRHTRILKKDIHVDDYNALRQYYQSRNRLLMWYQFPHDFSFVNKLEWLYRRGRTAFKILLAEEDKLRKIASLFRGLFWGALNIPHPYKKEHQITTNKTM